MTIDTQYLKDVLFRLVNTPSPVGDTERGTDLCRDLLCEFDGLHVDITRKGALVATWQGQNQDAPRAVTAHIDTLGAVVKEIKPNGRLKLSQLGNYYWETVENEGVTVAASGGRTFRGAILIENASHHIHVEASGKTDPRPRNEQTLEVRLDARTLSAQDTRDLGIDVGDYVYLDPRPEYNEGFIRSRHLDDKACLACVLAAVKSIFDANQMPWQRTTIHIPNYEEVGHGGASGFPPDIAEVLTIDIAPLGEGQNSDEFSCSLCVKDADGPYDVTMRRKLKRIAQERDIALRSDTYPEYCSDGDALWKSGVDARVALIGPGVDATHALERTHIDALIATSRLIAAYLLDDHSETV